MKFALKTSFWESTEEKLKEKMTKLLDFMFIIIAYNILGEQLHFGIYQTIGNAIFITIIILMRVSYNKHNQKEGI